MPRILMECDGYKCWNLSICCKDQQSEEGCLSMEFSIRWTLCYRSLFCFFERWYACNSYKPRQNCWHRNALCTIHAGNRSLQYFLANRLQNCHFNRYVSSLTEWRGKNLSTLEPRIFQQNYNRVSLMIIRYKNLIWFLCQYL